jgi:hypothetical protein
MADPQVGTEVQRLVLLSTSALVTKLWVSLSSLLLQHHDKHNLQPGRISCQKQMLQLITSFWLTCLCMQVH